ncbi:MAG TPA: ABC transporter ATP-binding protein [Flavisolibacter sp.]
MKIRLYDTGKRYNRDWIFRHADLEFTSGTAYAITGPNGSGKSTLLQTIAGMLQPSEGRIDFVDSDDQVIPAEKSFAQVSFCAPYLDVIEEMNLEEFLEFHTHFKPLMPGMQPRDVIAAVGLQAAAGKQIRFFSSGMKQRVKLAQAMLADTGVVLLDEPCTNLDAAGIELYHQLIRDYCTDKLVVVCSNDPVEYEFCTERINIMQYKSLPEGRLT